MDRPEQVTPRLRRMPDATAPDAPTSPASEFLCSGCGRPLAITLNSTMCFAEAQVYCDDCERDYREKRGRWAE
jgi:hypothetical protein